MSGATAISVGKRFAVALALGLCFASFMAFSLPVLIYAGNSDEFGTPLAQLLWPLLAPALASSVLFALLAAALPARLHLRMMVLSAALFLLCWLQGTVLVWEYGVFDGRGIDWTVGRWRGWVDAGLWIAVLLAADAWRDKLWRALPRLAIVAFAFQAAIACTWLARAPARRPEANAQVAELARFHRGPNVLHVLADGMQTDVVARLLAEDHGRLARELDGFVLFEDNLGAFPYTHMSLPAMLGGRVYDNSEALGPFLDEALGQGSIFAAAKASGYEVTVAQPGGGISEVYRHAVSARVMELPSVPLLPGWRGAHQERLRLGDLVLFRVVPHFAKAFVFNDQAWLLQSLFGRSAVPGRRFLAHVAFLHALAVNARADAPRPVYRFLHLMLSHRPIVVNADCSYAARALDPDFAHVQDQARCGFRALGEVLGRLHALGIYDDTTIVISGDHGTFLAPPTLGAGSGGMARAYELGLPPSMIGQARPLLLVKPARSRGPLRRSTAPSWIVDTPATIADAAGFATRPRGDSALRLEANAPRERRFMSYDYMGSDWSAEHLGPMQEFVARGPGDRVESWSAGRRLEAGGKAP